VLIVYSGFGAFNDMLSTCDLDRLVRGAGGSQLGVSPLSSVKESHFLLHWEWPSGGFDQDSGTESKPQKSSPILYCD
jgi:hypothetical protein